MYEPNAMLLLQHEFLQGEVVDEICEMYNLSVASTCKCKPQCEAVRLSASLNAYAIDDKVMRLTHMDDIWQNGPALQKYNKHKWARIGGIGQHSPW